MIKKVYFILIALFPICVFAQYEQIVVPRDCDDRVFTKVEILPSLKKGLKSFEDTLTYCLKSVNAFKNGTHVTYRFLVTTSSHIFDIENEVGQIQNDSIIKSFLIAYSFMWKAAIQNGRQVCAYVRLEIEISNDKLTVTIKQ